MEVHEETPIINPWFDEMIKEHNPRFLTVEECREKYRQAKCEYEEAHVVETEISKAAKLIKDEGGINQSTRVSLESYVNEDDVLPPAIEYTQSESRINYEETIAWMDRKYDSCLKQSIKASIKQTVTHLMAINSFAFEPESPAHRLAVLRDRATVLFQEHIKLNKEATMPVDEAVQQLAAMASALRLTEEDVDLSMFYDTLNDSLVPKTKQVLNTLGIAYLAPAMDPLLNELATNDTSANCFKGYVDSMDDSLIAILHSIKAGPVTGTAVEAVTPLLTDADACTTDYVIKLKPTGSVNNPSISSVDYVIQTLYRMPILIDSERDVRDKVMDAINSISIAYNLAETIGESVVDVKQPNTMLSCLQDINLKLEMIMEMVHVRRELYSRLENLMQRKVTLYEAYSVYLSCLAE